KPAAAALLLPPVALSGADIAVVINDADPASVAVGDHYAKVRQVPTDQVIHLNFPPDKPVLSVAEFTLLKAQVDRQSSPHVQAFALAWTQPYRVDCMSITAAFAFGFDPAYCADGCKLTKPSPYFNSDSVAPFKDHGIRPTMMLAARGSIEAKALIDRGVRSDDRWPKGKAYLMTTTDRERSVRASTFPGVERLLGSAYPIERVQGDDLRSRNDVMFYFTGLMRVGALDTDRFLDGAVADHLTSAGGVLLDSPQMSALEWIHAGATGTYGTALEPCNYRQKFPDVGVVMARYLSGETLIEAYWKSVLMPGQGVFVGEPLARPFGGVRTRETETGTDIETRALRPGRYSVQSSKSRAGPYRTIGTAQVAGYGVTKLHLPNAVAQTIRLVRDNGAPFAAPAAVGPASNAKE
ncbi:MAG: TIGR03790 family protein, partial [Caldimonas sp.]